MGVFEELNAVSVNGHTETKKSGRRKNDKTGQWEDLYLTYLSWPYAWAETKKRYPEASYTVIKNDSGLPFFYDENTGYMVYTQVTIEGITHEMWLPVMDGANRAMKAHPYTYSTQNNGDKTVEAATMTDINKTVMRCLVKNLAMFGLGLYIYAGEDLPEAMNDDAPKEASKPGKAAAKGKTQKGPGVEEAELRAKIIKYANGRYTADQIKQLCGRYGKESINQMSAADCTDFINQLTAAGHDIDKETA